MGVACLEFCRENFRRWLKNREICENFLPRKFPAIRYISGSCLSEDLYQLSRRDVIRCKIFIIFTKLQHNTSRSSTHRSTETHHIQTHKNIHVQVQGACLTTDITQVCITNIGIRLVTQRLEAVASRAKQSEIVDRQLINQIPDLHYPTIPYNTLQYLQYLHYPIVVTNTVI